MKYSRLQSSGRAPLKYWHLDEKVEEEDMVAALFRNMDTAKDAKSPETIPPEVQIDVERKRKTHEPDLVKGIEESQAARDRDHMLIATENPKPKLEVKIGHRMKGKLVVAGSTVSFQAIWNIAWLFYSPSLLKHSILFWCQD